MTIFVKTNFLYGKDKCINDDIIRKSSLEKEKCYNG